MQQINADFVTGRVDRVLQGFESSTLPGVIDQVSDRSAPDTTAHPHTQLAAAARGARHDILTSASVFWGLRRRLRSRARAKRVVPTAPNRNEPVSFARFGPFQLPYRLRSCAGGRRAAASGGERRRATAMTSLSCRGTWYRSVTCCQFWTLFKRSQWNFLLNPAAYWLRVGMYGGLCLALGN